MNFHRLLPFIIASIVGCLGVTATHADSSAVDSATTFINTRENLWFNYKSPAIQEAYPFGHSNAAHNAELGKMSSGSEVSKDAEIRNKHYLAEGDWYAVEWHYLATNVATGRKQIESSLCIAQIKNQQMVWWLEYFDDTVGELQMAGKLPLPSPAEEPTPWPLKAEIKRPYRP